MIKNLMHEGKLVPSELIVKLLLKAMVQSGNDKFLVDGFPRNEENRQAYDNIVRPPDSDLSCILVLKVESKTHV
jgi:UMP-CMP kinase